LALRLGATQLHDCQRQCPAELQGKAQLKTGEGNMKNFFPSGFTAPNGFAD